MKKICASLVVLLVLSGCGYKGGSEFLEMHDKSSIQKELPLNKITKQEIIAKFRKPNDESIYAAGETIDVGGKNIVAFNSINYSYIEGGANPASYIPVVGGLIRSNESENTFIYLWFDKNDKLIQYVFTKGQNSSGTKVEF